jgi:hypothetical protein
MRCYHVTARTREENTITIGVCALTRMNAVSLAFDRLMDAGFTDINIVDCKDISVCHWAPNTTIIY